MKKVYKIITNDTLAMRLTEFRFSIIYIGDDQSKSGLVVWNRLDQSSRG